MHQYALFEVAKLGWSEGKAGAAYTFVQGTGKLRVLVCLLAFLALTFSTSYYGYVAIKFTALEVRPSHAFYCSV